MSSSKEKNGKFYLLCGKDTDLVGLGQFPKKDKNKLDFKASHSRVLTENPSLIIFHPSIFTP